MELVVFFYSILTRNAKWRGTKKSLFLSSKKHFSLDVEGANAPSEITRLPRKFCGETVLSRS